MKKYQLLFISFFITIACMAQNPVTAHYYIFIKGSDSTAYDLEFGTIDFDKDFNPNRVEDKSLNLENIADELSWKYQDFDASQFDVFIHGIWAEKNLAWKEMAKNMQRDIYFESDYSRTLQLSILWDSNLFYPRGLEIAREKGDFFAPHFINILQRQDPLDKTNVMCHSMGNRVFQHLVKNQLDTLSAPLIDNFISVAADLETDVFCRDSSLFQISNIAKKSYVYVHNNDRTLKMSKLINGNKRLGCHGISNFEESDSTITTIDVTTIKDNEDFSSKIGNHRYFYMSPAVRADLNRIIWGRDFEKGKKNLGNPRRYMLDYNASSAGQ